MEKDEGREKLPELLSAAMKKRKMSVQGLASAVGVERQTCYAWLHEVQRPSVRMLQRLSDVLDIPFSRLARTVYPEVDDVRFEAIFQIYTGLSEENKDLLEHLARTVDARNREMASEKEENTSSPP